MELTLLERIVLQSILPKEGDFITFRLIKELRTELSFTEAEIKEFGIRQEGDRLMWDTDKTRPKNIEIGDTVKSIIVNALNKINEDGKVNDENYTLFEKFVNN